MDVKNLDEMMATKKRNIHLFGSSIFALGCFISFPAMAQITLPRQSRNISGSFRQGRGEGLERRRAADSKERGIVLGGQRLLSDYQQWHRAVGVVWQSLGSLRRRAYQNGRVGPQRARLMHAV